MWKVHYVSGNSNASGGDVSYYEDREDMEEAVLRALIEARSQTSYSNHYNHRRQGHRLRFFAWWEHVLGGNSDDRWLKLEVLHVWEQIDGEWVERFFDVEPPKLVEHAPAVQGTEDQP